MSYNLSADITGGDAIIKMLKFIPGDVKETVGRAMEKAGYKMEATAKGIAPVKTGSLRRNIKTQKAQITSDNIEVTVDASVKNKYGDDYAPFQEFGTRRGIKPKLYMKQSRENNEQYYLSEVEKALSDTIKKALSIF